MASRWKKVLADLWSNKTRTFLMVLTITVGVFSVGFVHSTGLIINQDMDADYLSANPSEAQLYVSGIDDDLVAAARRIPGVDNAEGRTTVSAQLILPGSKTESIQFTVIDSPDKLEVDILKPANPADAALPPLGDKEVLLDRSAQSLPIQPGDLLEIELVDGKTRQLRFAGFVHDVTGFPFHMAGTVPAFVNKKTGEWLGASSQYTQLHLSVAENQTDYQHVENVAQAVSNRLKKADIDVYVVAIFNPGHHFAWEITQGVIFILTVMGWLTVLLSSILIVNTINALMTQHTRQIGIMKAIGGGTAQIMGMYLVLMLAFGGLAFAVSVPLGSWAATQNSMFMANYLNFDLGAPRAYPQTIIMQAIVAFVVPLLAALYPLLGNIRKPVREAISDYGISNTSKQRPATESKRIPFLTRPVLISMRNTFRRKGRLALTLSTLILAGAIFIGVFNLWASFDQVMDDVQGYFLADVNLTFTRGYRFEKVKAIALSIPGVESVEGWNYMSGQVLSDDKETSNEVTFIAPPSSSTLIKPMITDGRWLAPGDENAIVIGNHLLNVRPDLKVGDEIIIEINGKETPWTIIGVYRLPGNVVPPLVYTNYEYLSRIIGETGLVYDLRVITTQHDAAYQEQVATQLQAAFQANKIPVAGVQTSAVWNSQQKSQTDVLVYFILTMAVLIAFVGGLGLMGTMSVNVLERTREVGVMRSIGASNLDIQWIVIAEGLVIGLISWAVALLLSLPITFVLTYGVGMAIFQAELPTVFGVQGMLAWLIGILIIAAIASALPARRASRLTVRDTLVYE